MPKRVKTFRISITAAADARHLAAASIRLRNLSEGASRGVPRHILANPFDPKSDTARPRPLKYVYRTENTIPVTNLEVASGEKRLQSRVTLPTVEFIISPMEFLRGYTVYRWYRNFVFRRLLANRRLQIDAL